MNWGEAYYDHFEKFLGKAMAVKIWDPDPSLTHNYPIQVLTYEIDKPIRVRAFCTLGLTHYAQELWGLAEFFYQQMKDGKVFLKYWDLQAG